MKLQLDIPIIKVKPGVTHKPKAKVVPILRIGACPDCGELCTIRYDGSGHIESNDCECQKGKTDE